MPTSPDRSIENGFYCVACLLHGMFVGYVEEKARQTQRVSGYLDLRARENKKGGRKGERDEEGKKVEREGGREDWGEGRRIGK